MPPWSVRFAARPPLDQELDDKRRYSPQHRNRDLARVYFTTRSAHFAVECQASTLRDTGPQAGLLLPFGTIGPGALTSFCTGGTHYLKPIIRKLV